MAFLGLSHGHDWWAHPNYEKVRKAKPCLLSVSEVLTAQQSSMRAALSSQPAMNHDAPRIVSIRMTALHVVVGDLCMGGLEMVRICAGRF